MKPWLIYHPGHNRAPPPTTRPAMTMLLFRIKHSYFLFRHTHTQIWRQSVAKGWWMSDGLSHCRSPLATKNNKRPNISHLSGGVQCIRGGYNAFRHRDTRRDISVRMTFIIIQKYIFEKPERFLFFQRGRARAVSRVGVVDGPPTTRHRELFTWRQSPPFVICTRTHTHTQTHMSWIRNTGKNTYIHYSCKSGGRV